MSVETIRSFGTISRYSPWKPTSVPSSVTITERHLPPTRRSISAIVASPRFACHHCLTSSGVVHASDLAEHPQVLRHLRLREPEHVHELVHRAFAVRENVQDLPPPRFRHGVERVCSRCGARHGGIIHSYIGIF